MSVSGFEQCLHQCIEKNEQILIRLNQLKEEMVGYHYTCNGVKTAGTAVSATGTGIILASVAAIPLTGGLSMLGGASGLAMTVGGSATNFITDWFDSSKTKTTIKEVQDLVDSKKEMNNQLEQHFDTIRDMEQKLSSDDITREDSLIAIFSGIANGSVDKVDADSGSPGLRLFSTLARIHRSDQLILKSYDLGVKNLELFEVMAPFAEKAFKAMGITGRVSAHTARTLGRISTGLSLVMTALDIALLVKDWSADHPTVQVIDNVVQKITEENDYLKEVNALIDSLKERVHYLDIEGLPIVGATHEFNKLVVHLIDGQSVKCEELLNALEVNHCLAHLQTPEQIALFITDETNAAVGLDRQDVESMICKQEKSVGPAVRAMTRDLLQTIDFENTCEVMSKPVISRRITSLYRDIIDAFVRETYGFEFSRMPRIPTESVVHKDYYTPIADDIKHIIEDVMIAKIPKDFAYIDSNAVFLSIATSVVLQSAEQQMRYLFSGGSADLSDKVKTAVSLLSTSRVYVDECALHYWLLECPHSDTRQAFDECRAAVHSMLDQLSDKLNLWVTDIKHYYPNRLYPTL